MKHVTKCWLLCFFLLGGVLSASAQKKAVSGTVVNQDTNEPLQGVTVTVKGTKQTATTDAKGFFSITLANRSRGTTLVFTYVGYDRKEIASPANEIITVPMTVSNKSMNEVVVVGYGSTKRSSITGSVSTVNLKQVEDVPNLNLSAALRGTVPGLSVSGGTERPGQGTTITVRNPVAFAKDGGQGTNPLFVIDDVIRTQADFDLLDVSQIESVSVLKDAEAAIYGVQGANGVVIVRTKRGHVGAPRLSFSTSVGASNATMLPKMLNSLQLATFNNDYTQASAFQQTASTGVGAPVNQFYDTAGYLHKADGTVASTRLASWYTPDELAYFSTHSHNYLKEAFQTAFVERAALNLTGGSDKITYFIGGDYVNQGSNFKGINSYKYGVRANIVAKPAQGLEVNVGLSDDIFNSRSYWYKINSTSESLDNDVASLQNIQPWQEYYIDGNPVVMGGSNTGGYDNVNYFQVRNSNNYTKSNTYTMNMMGKVTYEIPGIKGLTALFTINKNINNSNGKQFGTNFLYYKYSGLGENKHIPGGDLLATYLVKNGDRVRLNPVFANSYQLDAGFNYNHSFGKHSVSAVVLYEQREQNSEGVNAESDGVVNGGLDYQTFTTGTQTSNQSSSVSQFGFEAFISRLNYNYDGKYFLQLVYRADGSSRFTQGHNWGGFPAASVGWMISEEPWMKDVAWLNMLKVRASVGLTGTDNTKPYQYQANYKLGTGSSGGAVFNEGARSIGVQPNVSIPNVNVTWDHVTKTDYGLDMGTMNNRLTFSADYFWSHGYNLLTTLSSSVPATIGAAVPTENHNIVNMFGVELQAGWRDIIGRKFSYSFTPFFSWSDNKNILIDVASGNVGGPLDLTGKSSDAGVYGWKSAGIIRTQDAANAIIAARSQAAGGNSKVTIFNTPVQPGMINYVDQNNDGVIDDADQVYLTHKSSNHYSLGLNFSLGYDALTLNVIAGMSWGGWTDIDGQKPFKQSSGSTGASIQDNRPAYWANHWTPDNINAKYPSPYFVNDYDLTTDFWLVPATSLNITSATLSYTLPTQLVGKIGVSSARAYVVATNPFQFINPFPGHYRDLATSLYTYPTLRTVSVGLNVGF